ncbi:MAG: hypothetical protein IPG66_11845 [Hydrogenophilales bacterium]|nr:hypothetical protein [Hydrogenophilales bacterium]
MEQVTLTDDQAWALAQLCKRICFTDCRSNAVSNDEAYQMIDATSLVGRVLAEAGYAPR